MLSVPEGQHPTRKGSVLAFKAMFRERFKKWVNRRIPPARSVTLNQKRIFIFPSGVGFFFGLCLFVLLLTAINYQNNMVFALTFLLATLFVVGVLHTYANLSGLKIAAVRAQSAFPGQQAEFEVLFQKAQRRHHVALRTRWPSSTEQVINLIDNERATARLHAPVGERGWFSPGRLLIESTYPLGLLRCWTWIDLDLLALVYPRPIACEPQGGTATDTPDGASIPIDGNDDFSGFRDYRSGDSLRHVHWKGFARGQSLQVKQYTAYADQSVWLDWELFSGLDTETRLSGLCFWALEHESSNAEYGLRLPGLVIEPDSGEKHRDAVLKALALFGIEDRSP